MDVYLHTYFVYPYFIIIRRAVCTAHFAVAELLHFVTVHTGSHIAAAHVGTWLHISDFYSCFDISRCYCDTSAGNMHSKENRNGIDAVADTNAAHWGP